MTMKHMLALAIPAAFLTLSFGCAEEGGPSAPDIPPGAAKVAPAMPKARALSPDMGKPAEKPAAEAPKVEAPKAEAPKATPPKVEPPKTDDAKKSASAVKLSDDELAEIKKLPAADQPLAIKQAVCPISGHNLGSMEMPVKVKAGDTELFICCDGCKKAFEKDPKAALAKLSK